VHAARGHESVCANAWVKPWRSADSLFGRRVWRANDLAFEPPSVDGGISVAFFPIIELGQKYATLFFVQGNFSFIVIDIRLNDYCHCSNRVESIECEKNIFTIQSASNHLNDEWQAGFLEIGQAPLQFVNWGTAAGQVGDF
jgi:hypothetical protein